MELDTLYRRAVEHWAERVAAVADDQWEAATPCVDWSVRDLVNHVTGEELWAVPLVHGSSIEEVGDRFEGDLLGEDPRSRARAAADESVAAVTGALPAARVVHLSYGDEKLEEYVMQLSADHLVHGWDLAAATGQDRSLDPDLVDAVASWFGDREEMYRSGGAIGPRAASAGDPQSELLAAFGREAEWVSPG